MKLYKYRIFHIGLREYEEVNGRDTWFSEFEVTKAFSSFSDYSCREVHKIYLTTVCVLE